MKPEAAVMNGHERLSWAGLLTKDLAMILKQADENKWSAGAISVAMKVKSAQALWGIKTKLNVIANEERKE